MSSLRKAVPQKYHKERHQPRSRKKLGLLEKHKDYVIRARDYNRKKDQLRKLEEKAAFRNPDEFYFKMINTKRIDGIHRVENKTPKYSHDEIAEMKTQDINYLNMKCTQETKKIEKIEQNLCCLQLPPTETMTNHTIFVDNDDEVRHFSPAKFFDTVPEFLHRRFNRPRKSKLDKELIVANFNKISLKQLKRNERHRLKSYKELNSRLHRQHEITKVLRRMQLKKHLMGKGTVIKKRKDGKPPVYKWKKERKK
jgi:U3 small nucleolar RNA-associated protein 11